MVDLQTLIKLLSTIFILMMAGYIMTKTGVLPYSARGPLSALVIDFILPCNIIVSFLIEFNREILNACLLILLVSIGIEIFCFALAHVIYRKKEKGRRLVLSYATFVSNAGFLGNPIAQGLYGDEGLLYASIYLIPVRIIMWSAGVSLFSGTSDKHVLRKTLTHPCIVAVMIGIVLMIVQVQLPSGIENSLRAAGSCNTALSMIVIGNILAEIRIRDVISKDALLYSAVRLLAIPLVVFAACCVLRLPMLVSEVSTVLAGMPAPASAAILAAKYDGDSKLAVKLVFTSTLLSLFSIPLLCIIMGMFA